MEVSKIIIGSIGACLGYFVKYWLDKNKEINSENNRVKREAYKKFVSLIIDLFKDSSSENMRDEVNINFKNKLYEFYKDYILYSSPKVINALNELMQYLYKNENSINIREIMFRLSKVMREMRKEVGLSNWGLGKDSVKIFRAIFKDFDEISKK